MKLATLETYYAYLKDDDAYHQKAFTLFLKKKIEEMEEMKENLHYSRIGVLLCLFHIPCKMQNQYFCSQFVAETLELADSVFLSKNAALYLPNQLSLELCKQSCLKEIICNPV